MNIIWGAILTIFSLLGWLGQAITALSPKVASKLRLTEPESDVDPTFYADVQGEAIWDTIILWTLPVAGILLILNISLWAYFGLVGGGTYLYFAGRGILTRLAMQRCLCQSNLLNLWSGESLNVSTPTRELGLPVGTLHPFLKTIFHPQKSQITSIQG